MAPDGRAAKVGVDEQDPGVRRLGQSAGQVDGRGRFAVADRRRGDGQYGQVVGLMRLLHDVAQRPVLLSLE